MYRIPAIIMLTCGLSLSASADIWKWVDAAGNTHFVDSNTSIYTWIDENGKRYYADMPGHDSAVSVELAWHSKGDISNLQNGNKAAADGGNKEAYPGETPEDRFEREQAEAYYCKRAQQVYDSYVNAPRLYTTGDDGKRRYLSEEEAESTIAKTKAQVDLLCH